MNDILEWLNCGAALSRADGKLLLGYGKRRWHAEEEVVGSQGPFFFFPDFFLEKDKPYFTHEKTEVVAPLQLLERLKQHVNPLPPIETFLEGEALFNETFEELKKQFSCGTLKKAVPYIFCRAKQHITPSKLATILSSLIAAALQQKSFLYGFWNPKEGMVGATPEHLMELKGSQLKTVACAGTAPSDRTTQDPKLHSEHNLVVEGIEQALSPFGEVNITATQWVSFPPLAHLITPIEVLLNKSFSTGALVRALHPTPALGAFPKREGQLWLQEYNKKLPRGRYGAPVGAIGKDWATLYVAIRNMQWEGDALAIGAGCGVVEASVRSEEWQEVELKLSAIKKMLALLNDS